MLTPSNDRLDMLLTSVILILCLVCVGTILLLPSASTTVGLVYGGF